ncbi:hypothetical protein OQA88_6819 [Cercophora sp. LCS_1]
MIGVVPSTIRSPPELGDYTPLAEYQAQTPETFHGGKPILYYHATGAKAWIPSSQRGSLPIFPADLSSAPSAPESDTLSGSSDETLTLYSPAAGTGVSIPYPLITIHAIKTLGAGDKKVPSVYLQLDLADGGAGDDDFGTVELTLIPPAPTSPPEGIESGASDASKLFEAVSECSNLNPDPLGEDEEEEDEGRIIFEGEHEALEGYSAVYAGANDGGLPPPLPGSGGWITADNVHEFFDADGNWIGGEEEGVSGELGEGAGTVRRREEEDEANGHEREESADSKRPRVE